MTEVILTAIEGMSDSSAYDTLAAARMLAVAMRHSASRLQHASRIVRCIYENLMHVSEQLARCVLLRTLLQLTSLYPEKAVRSLLASSVPCDSVAVAMWQVMVSQPTTAEKVLGELLFMLQERRQGRRVCFVEDEPHVVPLAATRALREILLQPTLQQGKALFPMLCVALLFQISFAMEATLQDVEAFFKTDIEEGRGSPISPVRSTLQALQALLHWAGYGEQVGVLHKTGGWDMLICAESHHQGITLLARQLRTSATKECHWIFHHLLLVLSMRDVQREIPSMAFFTELLNCAEFSTAVDEQVLRLFQRHLRTGRLVMRGLVLRGLLTLSESPEVVSRGSRAKPCRQPGAGQGAVGLCWHSGAVGAALNCPCALHHPQVPVAQSWALWHKEKGTSTCLRELPLPGDRQRAFPSPRQASAKGCFRAPSQQPCSTEVRQRASRWHGHLCMALHSAVHRPWVPAEPWHWGTEL
ncbi:maestro heat-like repeat-containing protein family member 7 [Dromaius novaehollandiae]|uniref:maestro heat-like repeat-containing protein family member 7 n=1 Tax=Dromaius novaehollandiae TaxID=8790 RepID=UPI00311EF5B8